MAYFKDDFGAEVVMRVTCQACGTQIFRKQTGYNNIDAASENRHSLLDQFEPMPEGWSVKHDLGGWCCPDCIKQYEEVIDRFRSDRKFEAAYEKV